MAEVTPLNCLCCLCVVENGFMITVNQEKQQILLIKKLELEKVLLINLKFLFSVTFKKDKKHNEVNR